MDTTTFSTTWKNKVASFEDKVTVTREPANLQEHRALHQRWFDYVGEHVVACNTVSVTVERVAYTPKDGVRTLSSPTAPWTDTYVEVVTATGRGCLVQYGLGWELMAFIPTAGKALVTGCWKKHGRYVGTAAHYLTGHGLSVDSRAKVDHVCISALYDAARGKVRAA